MVAAVQVLLARVADNPLSDWTSLISQVVRAAMDCQGLLPFLRKTPTPFSTDISSAAFTAEQMSRLSDILEAALPRSSSSPVSSRRSSATPDSMFRHVAPLQSSRKGNTSAYTNGTKSYGDLAKELGVDTQIVEALIKRLSDFP